MVATYKLIPIDSMTKSIRTPAKLVEAYNSLTKMIGTSFTNTSLNMPPPTAVQTPANVIVRMFNPNKL